MTDPMKQLVDNIAKQIDLSPDELLRNDEDTKYSRFREMSKFCEEQTQQAIDALKPKTSNYVQRIFEDWTDKTLKSLGPPYDNLMARRATFLAGGEKIEVDSLESGNLIYRRVP